MARPQIENGLTPLANELVEAFCYINLSAYESRVLWFLFRKTYGFHKKTDRISYSQLETGTGLKRWHINRTIERLVKRNIITKTGEGHNLEYGVQKDYDLWKSLENNKESLPIEVTNIVTQTGNKSLPKEVTINQSESLPQQVESLPQQVEVLPQQVTKSLPKEVNTKEIKIIQKIIQKKEYGEFNNVLLFPEEYQKLIGKFTEVGANKWIETLSSGMAARPQKYKYTNHYAAILQWARRDEKEGNHNNGGNNGQFRKGLPGNKPAGAFDDIEG